MASFFKSKKQKITSDKYVNTEHVEQELINGAADELHRFFEELRLEGEKTGNDIGNLETEFGNLIVTASNNDANIKEVTNSIADRVKSDPRPRKAPGWLTGYTKFGGRKQRGGNFTCTPFRKKLIKLLIIAGLFTGVYTGSGVIYTVFEGFFTKAFRLLSTDIQRSLGDLYTAIGNYIEIYIRAAIDSLRMSVQLNNSTLWEAFLNNISWTNFGKLFAGITAFRQAAPAASTVCNRTSETLDSIVENICKELESKFQTITTDSGTQTDLSEEEITEATKQGTEQGNKITKYFTRSSCNSKGGRKSRRRSIKKNRKTRRKTSSKKTNKKRRRSKRKTSRR
jgi:hypothetical protein